MGFRSSLNSKKYCPQSPITPHQLSIKDVNSIAHFDKEKPEPQTILQATTSLKDVYPNHESTSQILQSVRSHVKTNLPFMVLNWESGLTERQYFRIASETYQAISWNIVKHSYHSYQLPAVFQESKKASHLQKIWKNKCSFNLYDIFQTRTNTSLKSNNHKKLDKLKSTNQELDEKTIIDNKRQKLFDKFSTKLYNISKLAETDKSYYPKFEKIVILLNQISSFQINS